MKKIFLLILVLSVFISCNYKKKSISTKNENRIDSAIWSIIDKYNIPYKLYSNEIRDTLNILNRFPLIKSIRFPEGINVEFRIYIDCHQYIELIVFYDEKNISIVPFYGTSFFKKFLMTDRNTYMTVFETELNKTFNLFYNHIDGYRPLIKYSNSIFHNLSIFVKFIMKEIEFYDIEIITNTAVLNYYKENIKNTYYYTYNKQKMKQDFDTILKLNMGGNYDLYGIPTNMVLKFNYRINTKGEFNADVKTYNFEAFEDIIF